MGVNSTITLRTIELNTIGADINYPMQDHPITPIHDNNHTVTRLPCDK